MKGWLAKSHNKKCSRKCKINENCGKEIVHFSWLSGKLDQKRNRNFENYTFD